MGTRENQEHTGAVIIPQHPCCCQSLTVNKGQSYISTTLTYLVHMNQGTHLTKLSQS